LKVQGIAMENKRNYNLKLRFREAINQRAAVVIW